MEYAIARWKCQEATTDPFLPPRSNDRPLSPPLERELRALIQDAIPADQFVEAVEYLLARDPLVGTPTDDLLVWAMPMAPIGEGQIVLYYSFNDSTVWLLSISRV